MMLHSTGAFVALQNGIQGYKDYNMSTSGYPRIPLRTIGKPVRRGRSGWPIMLTKPEEGDMPILGCGKPRGHAIRIKRKPSDASAFDERCA